MSDPKQETISGFPLDAFENELSSKPDYRKAYDPEFNEAMDDYVAPVKAKAEKLREDRAKAKAAG